MSRRTAWPLFLLLVLPAAAQSADTPPAERYLGVTRNLERFIGREMADKGLPALSVALVDGQDVVWARGFGSADPKAQAPATAETVYRVGSVSKLFTDVAVMQLVEKGALDLDAPVTKYLPDFAPKSRFDKPVTLRQLMTHRAGLVREPPVGHYFDPDGLSLRSTVESLNGTELLYEPGTRMKYSNAGVAAVGYVLERTQGEPFAPYIRRALLTPLGMTGSAFAPTPEIDNRLARGVMWTYHGREFPAPTFQLGIGPAGSLYAPVTDLAKFLAVLHAGGRGMLKSESLAEMFRPQFAPKDAKRGVGLGFFISEFAGKRRVGHNGAVYGFATELADLPDEQLGVVVAISRDVTNAVAERVADEALRQMLAVKQGKSLPAIATTEPLAPGEAKRLAGRYALGERHVDLLERGGKLYLLSKRGGYLTELRRRGPDLVIDDRLDYGLSLRVEGDELTIAATTFKRVPVPKPPPCPEKWRGLIGEYGWDHDILYVLEKDGKLHALIEWFFLYPLEEESENVFRFPDHGLYQDEKIIFTRDAAGRATQALAAEVKFVRRHLDGEDGRTFRIAPRRPLAELRREAAAATPPVERNDFARPDLVDLTTLDPTIKLDIRYASDNNFLSTPFYRSARAFLQRPAAEALLRAHQKLKEQGYGLLIHDGYRPWSVTKMFWDATPDAQRIFVADPSQGSRHNRGCAVDLTLYDLATGKPVEMTGGYDEMSDRSYPGYMGGTSLQRWHRELLRRAMEDEGFTVYEAEWWHFDYKDWRKYPILNVPFEQLGK
jgi:CubicO group peptidase (beta-lactamase class C family)/D-alanyl-D-alanine dipeptidase